MKKLTKRAFCASATILPFAAAGKTEPQERLYTEDEVNDLACRVERNTTKRVLKNVAGLPRSGDNRLVELNKKYDTNLASFNEFDRAFVDGKISIDNRAYNQRVNVFYEKRYRIIDEVCTTEAASIDDLKAQFEVFYKEFSCDFRLGWGDEWGQIVDNLRASIGKL